MTYTQRMSLLLDVERTETFWSKRTAGVVSIETVAGSAAGQMRDPVMKFSETELLAQQRLQEESQMILEHPRLCSQGRALMAALGGDIDVSLTLQLLERYRRVLFFGSAEQIEAARMKWHDRNFSVDSDMIWISSPVTTVLEQLGECDGASLDGRFRIGEVSPTTDLSILREMQDLQRANHLVPTPTDFFQRFPDAVSTYVVDETGQVVGATSCLFLRLRGTAIDRSIMMMNTCVSGDLRRCGLAMAMRHRILPKAIEKFSPERVGSVVRPTNTASLGLNGRFGSTENNSIRFAMVEVPG